VLRADLIALTVCGVAPVSKVSARTRVYNLAANTSTRSMIGGAASSSGAFAISAAAIGPAK
jgi:hypothetical protein